MDLLSTVYVHAVAASALAVVAIQQVLKLKLVPLQWANKYPVPTLIVLSIGASIWTVVRTSLNPQSWTDWCVLVASVAVTAALTYIATIKNWAELRSLEG